MLFIGKHEFSKILRNNTKEHDNANKMTIALFVVYLIASCWILLFKLGVQFSYMKERKVNLIPFNQPLILNGEANFGEVLMNVMIFLPLGIYAGILFKRWSFGRNLFLCFLISFVIEALQFILRVGAFDVTDIIANTLGGLLGLVLFNGIERVFNNSLKAQKFINTVATIGTVLILVLLFLLKTDNLGVRYQ